MLKFIGTGSAFNTKLGNTSAYIKEGKHLFLIDCGSANYTRMGESGLLDDIEFIYVFITHTHPDHVGSLGDLIFHMYYTKGELKPRVKVYEPFGVDVEDLLTINGVREEHYLLEDVFNDEIVIIEDMKMAFVPFVTQHDKTIYSYGLIVQKDDKICAYTSDTNRVPDDIFIVLHMKELVAIYIDTCSQDYDGNVHLSLKKLTEAIPVNERHKFWCMHLDKQFDVEYAKSLGFNVAKNNIKGFI